MQYDDTTQPLELEELRQRLTEWNSIASQMLDLLYDSAASDTASNWRPHAGQIAAAIAAFRDRCRNEAQNSTGLLDDCSADEVLDGVRDQGQRLVNWLHRIMAD